MMSNELTTVDLVQSIKVMLSSPNITESDISELDATIKSYPRVLDFLSLEDFTKMSTLGIDLSVSYVNSIRNNNIKAFLFKYVIMNMERVSKLVDILTKIEDKFYESIVDRPYITDKSALAIISQIQSSIESSVSTMMKMTSNDSLINFMIVEMNQINNNIVQGLTTDVVDSTVLLPLDSRKKISYLVKTINDAIAVNSEVDNNA